MKVLHVITYLSDGGGAEKLLEDLLPSMQEKGVDVSVAVLKHLDSKNYQKLMNAGINIITIGTGANLYSFSKMLKLLPIMKQYDVVHTHLTPPFLMGAFNSFFCKNTKFVCTIHNTDSKLRHLPLFRYIEKWAYCRYKALIACSKEAEDALRKIWDNGKTCILTINNGVKLEKFMNAQPSDDIVKISGKKIVMVAVFRSQKDHKCLIRAAKLLPEDFHVFFVGYGGLLEEMRKFSESLGISSRIHFLGKRTDVPNILKASDIVVLSSHYEGLSLSSIEGMAAGKPFLASDVPGLHEIVNGYGILFPQGDAKALANFILNLSNDSNYYNTVANKCWERAQMYDMQKMVNEYYQVYLDCMSNRCI